MKQRELELSRLLAHDGTEGALKAKYPWDDFASKMVTYFRKDREGQGRVAAASSAVNESFSDGQQPAEGSEIEPVTVPEKNALTREHRLVIYGSSFVVDSNLSARKPPASRVT
jgi:hypothetical protein